MPTPDGSLIRGFFNLGELYLSNLDNPNVIEEIRKSGDATNPYGIEGRVNRIINCSELVEGRSEEEDRQRCAGILPASTYDPARYPLTTPIYYFHGQWDPATPLAGLMYHLKVQGKVERFVVQVERAGHNPLGIQLAHCKIQIWEDLFSSIHSQDLSRSLNECKKETPYVIDTLRLNAQVNFAPIEG